MFRYANDLHYLTGEIANIYENHKKVVLNCSRCTFSYFYLGTQTLVPEEIVILCFEMLRTFCKPMSLINSEFGGYAFGIFLLFPL